MNYLEPALNFTVVVLVGMSTSVLATRFIPIFNDFLKYGKTNYNPSSSIANYSTVFQRLSKYWSVPKDWFCFFYILSLIFSVFTLLDWYFDPTLFNNSSIPISCILLLAHSIRRCYETMTVMGQNPFRRHQSSQNSQPSKRATMQLPHFIVGLIFYSCINFTQYIGLRIGGSRSHGLKLLAGILLFTLGSYFQWVSHLHISSLQKYSLPTYPSPVSLKNSPRYVKLANLLVDPPSLFGLVACPHYTSELAIYIGIALASPSKIGIFSSVQWAILGWILINLGVSAEQTKKWYSEQAKLGLFSKTAPTKGQYGALVKDLDNNKLYVPEYAIIPGLF